MLAAPEDLGDPLRDRQHGQVRVGTRNRRHDRGISHEQVGEPVDASFDAPAELVALQASIAVGVACGWVITLWWKISVHAAIAAGAATVLTLVFGTALLAAWPLVALICWSRVQVGDHTPAQVLAGVALGVVVNATIFPLLQ
jgi:membrane-associated phospholipid phosphatase